MDTKQLEKSLRQMRGVFGFFAALNILGFILNLIVLFIAASNGASDVGMTFFYLILCALFALSFRGGYKGTQDRTQKGYNGVKNASTLLLIGFPVLTIFGIIYLNKLSKPEMKALFGFGTANQAESRQDTSASSAR